MASLKMIAAKVMFPPLRTANRFLFRLSLAFVLFHAGMAFDFIGGGFKRHSLGAWNGVTGLFPTNVWGLLHLVCFLILCVGLYLPRHLLKVAFWITTVLAAMMAVAFLIGALTTPASSFAGSALFCLAALVSAASAQDADDTFCERHRVL